MKNIIIGISKGRILIDSLIYLKYKNIKIKDNILKSRKLIFNTNKKNIKIILIKNLDIINFLNKNIIDICITGKDILINSKVNNFIKYKDLYISKSSIWLIANKNFFFSNIKNYIKIKTKYDKLSNYFFKYKNINSKILKLNGNIELSLLFKDSDFIIDIIGTGETILKNKLFKIEKLMKLNAILAENGYLIYKKFYKNFFLKFFFNDI